MRDEQLEHALGLQGADDGTRTDDIVFAAEPTRTTDYKPRSCPFCGGTASLKNWAGQDGNMRFWVDCDSSQVTDYEDKDSFCSAGGPHRSTAIDALDAWNYRPRSFLTARKPGRVTR